MAVQKFSSAEQRAILKRFQENLYPEVGGKSRRDPGAVVDRLHKAGLPRGLVTQFLFAFALGDKVPRKARRERERSTRALLQATIYGAQVKARWLRCYGQTETAESAESEKREAERAIKLIRESGMYETRGLGVAPLEYLVELQECARQVASPLTEGELAGLVWAAVSALHPKAERIEPDSLARGLNRFRKRNPDFVKQAAKAAAELLLSVRIGPLVDRPMIFSPTRQG